MRTIVASKLTLLQGACSAEAADYRSCLLELFLARGQVAAKRRSVLWVCCNDGWRNKSAFEHNDRSSWTLRPDADTHFSANGKCVLVSPRVKARVRVPSPSVDGVRPRLRRGRLVARGPLCLARHLSGLRCVVWCRQTRHQRRRRCKIVCSTSKMAVMTTRTAMTTAMAVRTSSLCKVTLKRYGDRLLHHAQAMSTGWVKFCRCGTIDRTPFKHLLAAHLLLSGESWEKKQQAADFHSVWE